MIRSLSTSAFGHPSETKEIFGAGAADARPPLAVIGVLVRSSVMRLLGMLGGAWQAEDSMTKTRPHEWAGPVSSCIEKKSKQAWLFCLGQLVI
jgi:hypothetical protein